MSRFVEVSVEESVAAITLCRGKVNAINEAMADEFLVLLDGLAKDSSVKAVSITGNGRFFSFGLDIPEFLAYSKPDFFRFVRKFADLYTVVYEFPKPVIAGLNGHTIAGGCMLALACDYRLMATGGGRISLNEITFGSSLFPGSVEMLVSCVGRHPAELVAYTGAMYSPEEARAIGLIDESVDPDALADRLRGIARQLAAQDPTAFASIKMLLRKETARRMRAVDEQYSEEMIDIWYSESTWKKLQTITIR